MRAVNDYNPKEFKKTLDKIKKSPFPSGFLRAGSLGTVGLKDKKRKVKHLEKQADYSKADYEV